MRTRGLALVLALLVALAPAALALCQLTCASSADAHNGTHQAPQHSCHAGAAPATSHAIAAIPHACSHGEELPAACGVAVAGDESVPLALVVTPTLGIVPSEQPAVRWTPDDGPLGGSPSAFDALALRV
jgi:hypothetical protein